LFGQTEGLLGSDLELRELQKEGKIGRIDVNLESQDGKTVGRIEIPSALDKAETTIVAAALETIERIGPSDSKIEIEKIEDVRGNKRDYIIDRAKKLLEKIEGSTESREIGDAVRVSSRVSRLQEYGNENLPAGDISGNEIIVVEGRADVVNMLKAGVKNVIAMNGTILPETIKELSLEKETTLFVDGDRGGQLIAKNTIDNAKIDFVAKAPDGKEVEELTPKEILMSLRKKLSTGEFLTEIKKNEKRTRIEKKQKYRPGRTESEVKSKTKAKKTEKIGKMSEEEKEKMREIMEDITGTKGAVLLNENLDVIKKIPISQLQNQSIESYAVIVDGTATSSVVRAAEKINCRHLIARNFAYAETDIDLMSL